MMQSAITSSQPKAWRAIAPSRGRVVSAHNFRVTSLETTDFDVLASNQHALAGKWPRGHGAAIFADVFAESRLVGPPKSLLHAQFELEARVGIEPAHAGRTAGIGLYFASRCHRTR